MKITGFNKSHMKSVYGGPEYFDKKNNKESKDSTEFEVSEKPSRQYPESAKTEEDKKIDVSVMAGVYGGPAYNEPQQFISDSEHDNTQENKEKKNSKYPESAMINAARIDPRLLNQTMTVYGGPDFFNGKQSSGFAAAMPPVKSDSSQKNTDMNAKFCAECGSKLLENAKFCTECGAKVIKND